MRMYARTCVCVKIQNGAQNGAQNKTLAQNGAQNGAQIFLNLLVKYYITKEIITLSWSRWMRSLNS